MKLSRQGRCYGLHDLVADGISGPGVENLFINGPGEETAKKSPASIRSSSQVFHPSVLRFCYSCCGRQHLFFSNNQEPDEIRDPVIRSAE